MDDLDACNILLDAGYLVVSRLPSGFVMKSPDGRFVRQREAIAELDRVTNPDGKK